MRLMKLRHWTLAVAALVGAVLVTSAAATTSPTNYKIFNVRLTDHGVVFTPKAQLQLGEVGLFRVTNSSKTKRVFTVSGRSTHALKGNDKEAFYELFPSLGKVKWVSHAVKGRSFDGFVTVVPCKDSSGTSSCNGTDN